MSEKGEIVKGKTHAECDNEGCGEDYVVNQTGQSWELESGEAIIIPSAFDLKCFIDSFCENPAHYIMTGTIAQIASAINAIGGGVDFAPGASLRKNGRKMSNPRLIKRSSEISTRTIDAGSVVINRKNMLNPHQMTFEGTTYKIANDINTFGGNGDALPRGGKIDDVIPVKAVTYFSSIGEKYKNPYELNRAIEEYLLENESKAQWSVEEKNFIMQYSGYGGLEKLGDFSDAELKGLLYEYYTPDAIVKKMWALAYKYGYGTTDLSMCETSVGTGNFLKYAPSEANIVGYDINPYSVLISQILFPHATIIQQSFEKLFISRNESIKNKILPLSKYSLVIGNPPYGKAESKYMAMGEKNYTKATNWVEYFITRGLDLLHSNGLLIYVVGAEQYNGGKLFLDGPVTPAKKDIHKKAMLVDAYRLPANLFERTGVSTEILVFKKY